MILTAAVKGRLVQGAGGAILVAALGLAAWQFTPRETPSPPPATAAASPRAHHGSAPLPVTHPSLGPAHVPVPVAAVMPNHPQRAHSPAVHASSATRPSAAASTPAPPRPSPGTPGPPPGITVLNLTVPVPAVSIAACVIVVCTQLGA